jgi:acetyltransferase-like isoleucine patch superfamily enzyme
MSVENWEKKGVTLQEHVIINKQPVYGPNSLYAGQSKKLPDTIIGEGCIICTFAVIYAGTKLGKKCFVADGASIRENVEIGDESVIGRMVTIECNTKIGNRSKIQTGAHITADCMIGDDCFIGPEVCTMNDKYMGVKENKMQGPIIGNGVLIGGNATILPGVKIGNRAIISAGAVVTKDVPKEEIWMGNPAKCVMLRKWFDKFSGKNK